MGKDIEEVINLRAELPCFGYQNQNTIDADNLV